MGYLECSMAKPLPRVPPAAAPRRSVSMRDLALPMLLSVSALGLILYFTYEPGAWQTLRASLRPSFFALALVALAAQLLLGGLRLRHISHRLISLRGGIRAQLAWDFMSAVTPSAIGGAPFASLYVARDNDMPVGQATGLMLFSMLMDQVWFATTIPVIFLATASIDIFPPSLGDAGAGGLSFYFVLIMLWAVFFAYATVVRPEIIEKVTGWLMRLKVLRRFEDRVMEEMEKLKAQARVLRGQPLRFYLIGYFLSAGVWLCRYFVVLFIAWSVVPTLDAVEFVFRTIAMWLTALAIPTPGGSGGMEALYMLFLAPLMPKSIAGATLFVWRLLAYHLLIVLGLFLTSHTIREALVSNRDTPAATVPS